MFETARRRLIPTAIAVLLLSSAVQGRVLWKEDFESYAPGSALNGQGGWELFQQATMPNAVVAAGAGTDGSKGLAVSADAPFRADYMGLTRKMEKPLQGILWMQCRFKPPKGEWRSSFMLKTDLQWMSGQVVPPDKKTPDAPAKLGIVVPYWSGYRANRHVDLDPDRWYTLTMRLDTGRKTCGAWIDGKPMMEKHVLETDKDGVSFIYLCAGGTPEAPAYLDDVVVTDEAPAWHADRPEFPPAKEGLLFRFAAVQDPQVGFHKAEHDLWAAGRAVEQINAAGADLTVFMGDMTHKADDEEAAKALKQTLDGLKGRWFAARGNHDEEAIFTKYFAPALEYSVEHKGVRFVVLNAVGNEAPITDTQLAWMEEEFKKAKAAGQMIVTVSHCSPWDDNERGRGKYNRLGEGKEKLKAVMKQYGAILSLSGHYHRGAWHAEQDGTHYVIPAGTSMMRGGPTGFCLFDAYPDRIEVFVKQLLVPYDDAETREFFHLPYAVWAEYAPMRQRHPYLMQGPVTIPRK